MKASKPNNKRAALALRFFYGVIIVLLAAGSWLYSQLKPVGGSAEVKLQIPAGISSRQIASLLHQNGLVRNEQAYRIYLWWTRAGAHLQAGNFQLSPGMSASEITATLTSGKSTPDTVKVTIPEGYTIEQIADRLNQLGLVDKTSFLTEADHGSFQSSLVSTPPANTPVRHRLEGCLFPSTYEIEQGTTSHQIIQLMLDRMQLEITPPLAARWKAQGLTVNQGLTLASLIEREARVDAERPVIAQVILSRMEGTKPMPLQIDATIQYIVGQKPELSLADLKIESPYNTYLHMGLPPGPIANPGEASLLASCDPAPGAYLYYVTKNDGSGEHYFSTTYQQQLNNEQLSQQNVQKGGAK